MIDIEKFFEDEEHDEEYAQHQNISPERRLHDRPDLNAFLLLDKLVPGTHVMVDAAEHDEIYLNTDPEELAEVATEEDLIDLIRCGVRYDPEIPSLCMFV